MYLGIYGTISQQYKKKKQNEITKVLQNTLVIFKNWYILGDKKWESRLKKQKFVRRVNDKVRNELNIYTSREKIK